MWLVISDVIYAMEMMLEVVMGVVYTVHGGWQGGRWGGRHGGEHGGWQSGRHVGQDTWWRLLMWLGIGDTYGCGVREIVVLIMEVNKVADEVADMEIDK